MSAFNETGLTCRPAVASECIARVGCAALSDDDVCLGCGRAPEDVLRELAQGVKHMITIIDDTIQFQEESESPQR